MNKTDKLINLAIVLGLGAGVYFLVTFIMRQKEEKAVAEGNATQQEQLRVFNRALTIWIKKIKRAQYNKIEGWEDWYEPIESRRKYLDKNRRAAALHQISIHSPELIPEGYSIYDNGDGLVFGKY